MADIFVSYAREDEARIQPLIRALLDQGWSVFWDRRIPAGQTWRSYIGKALSDASCVIVAWSRHSIASAWVSEEADEGKQRGILVPVLLDSIEVPIGFRSIQAADLTEWQSSHHSPRFEQLLHDIHVVLGATSKPLPTKQLTEPMRDAPKQPYQSPPWKLKVCLRRLPYALIAAVLILVAGGGYWIYRSYYQPLISPYQIYHNKRLHYSISYPTNLLSPQGESADGSSQRFVSKDGRALLIITGTSGRSTADLQDLYERQSRGATSENPTRVVTYKVKKDDWFVVSGYEQRRIWYEKTITSSSTLISFRLEYDESQKQFFDPVVGTMAKSFAILPEGQ